MSVKFRIMSVIMGAGMLMSTAVVTAYFVEFFRALAAA